VTVLSSLPNVVIACGPWSAPLAATADLNLPVGPREFDLDDGLRRR
jgi:glycine/D-amino acid oxidase-like deaminating enzyme